MSIAGSALLDDIEVNTAAGQTESNSLLNTFAAQNLDTIRRALRSMEAYWSGCGYALAVLDQRAAKIDSLNVPSPLERSPFISLPDRGLLKRFKSE